MMDPSTLLLIGIGNPLRQDDGAGWLIAERLAGLLPGARRITVQQLAPELAVELAAPGLAAVCFCDVRAGAPGLLLEELGEREREPARMSHEIDPGTLLAYASTLGARPLRAWVVTVGGQAFDHGEGLSATVTGAMGALPEIAALIAAELARSAGPAPAT